MMGVPSAVPKIIFRSCRHCRRGGGEASEGREGSERACAEESSHAQVNRGVY